MTGALTLGYRDAVAVADSPLAPAGTRAHGHEFHRTAIRAPAANPPAKTPPAKTPPAKTPPAKTPPAEAPAAEAAARISAGEVPARVANAWRWQAGDAVVTEGLIRGGVHASYLHTHWNGIPGAADRMVAAARAHHAARAHD
jgi:cobyrinic acid a,c-diamide synthase